MFQTSEIRLPPVHPRLNQRQEPRRQGAGRLIGAIMLAGVVFAADATACLGGSVAVLYALVLLLACGPLDRRAIIGWAGGCAMLALIGFALSPRTSLDGPGLLCLGSALVVNAVTMALLLRTRGISRCLDASEGRYRTIFDTLALAIWEHDFTPLQAALADLRASGVSDLRQYLNDHPEFVIKARRMVRITDVNETGLRMMGVRDKAAFFTHLSGFLPETDESFADCILAIDERRPLFQAETSVIPVCGRPIDIIITFGLGGSMPLDRVPGCILDISERKRLEATVARTRMELERAQRAELLGAITASIAHEINQPLAAIRSFTDATKRWLMRDKPDMRQVDDTLAGLSEAVDYAHEVIRRTRSLVKSSRAEAAPVDLNMLLFDAATLMRQEAVAHEARIIVEPDGESNYVLGDRILLQQVLVNLVTNALQAMDAVPPPRRLIRLTVCTAQNRAVVRVADTGPGWKADIEDRLVGAFITTKAEGMGLGLSICRSVLEAHAGDVHLRHAPGGGAEVELAMPAWAPPGG